MKGKDEWAGFIVVKMSLPSDCSISFPSVHDGLGVVRIRIVLDSSRIPLKERSTYFLCNLHHAMVPYGTASECGTEQIATKVDRFQLLSRSLA